MNSFLLFKAFKFLFIRCLLGFLISNVLIAQNHQLELTVSNDKFVLSDRYYTSGLHFTYRKNLGKSLLFSKEENNKLQLNVTVGNETYTPKNLNSFNSRDFDRPYAGWLFGKIELGKVNQKTALFLALESGITGKESLAGKLQIELHEFLNIDSRPTWVDEIAYNWLLNAKALYVNDFRLDAKNSIQNHISASVGSKDTFVENNIYYFFGNFNTLQNSARLNLSSENRIQEFFGFISGGYKYVALNTLIQGSPFNEDDLFTSIATKHILKFSAGAVLTTKKNNIKLAYYYNTKETLLSTSHAYGAITFGFIF